MHAKNSASGGPYSYNFSLPVIDASQAMYQINYQVFYLCDGTEADCRSIGDSITLSVNELSNTHEFDELTDQPTWVKKTIMYQNTGSQLRVNIYIFIFVMFNRTFFLRRN